MTGSEQWKRGEDIHRKLAAGNAPHDDQVINEIFPDFLKMQVEHLFGGVWSRPGLGLKERIMVSLTCLIFHKLNPEMAECMRWGLNNGVSREEILEICMHVAHYAGWPTGVNAIHVAGEILPSPEKKEDAETSGDLELTASEWIDKGIEMLNKLSAGKEKIWGGDLDQVFPDYWKMHLGHLFGEVFSRPGLRLRERIMVNLSGLIFHKFSFGTANCIRWALNNEISREEVLEICMHVAHYAGWPCGVNAIRIAGEVFSERDKQ
jgi:4-carboxymuconolactone decarboxylase